MGRKVDELGRVVLPVEVRKQLGIQEGDALEIYVRENEIVLKKSILSCVVCNSYESLITLEKYSICESCLERFNRCRMT